MHICFITHEYPKKGSSQGGIGSVVQTIGRSLVNEGHHVSVVGIGNYEEGFEEDNGVKIYRLQRAEWKIANFIPNTRKVLSKLQQINEEYSIDVIEGAELDFAFFPRSFYAKKVIRMHGGHHFFSHTTNKQVHWWRALQEKLSFTKADAFIAVSDYVGKTTTDLLNETRKYEVIYNLVDTNKFYKANRSKIKKNKILFVGTIVEKKGVMQLVESMQYLKDKFKDLELELIGRDNINHKTKESYMQHVKDLMPEEMHQYIKFIGPKPHSELPQYMEKAEICVYPSHMEAQGIVVVEAMSMGKAVVFSKTGPGAEMIQHGKNGLLCDPYDPMDIANQLGVFLENRDKVVRCGDTAREDVLKKFDMKSLIKKNIDFYEQLIGKK